MCSSGDDSFTDNSVTDSSSSADSIEDKMKFFTHYYM